ncbi:hypothetical protein E2C01_060511 [Portunus trituberculatus]|uniref:Uncharacterized protein n=1 Tax=Portunus trituberculatus TaxID=210409 RepID=A0A5B7HCA5_PORTR|nr:hypothetical protein [Portunus trituberculatus]
MSRRSPGRLASPWERGRALRLPDNGHSSLDCFDYLFRVNDVRRSVASTTHLQEAPWLLPRLRGREWLACVCMCVCSRAVRGLGRLEEGVGKEWRAGEGAASQGGEWCVLPWR